MAVRDGGSAAYVAGPHTDNAGLSTSLALCCRTQNVERLTEYFAVVNKAGLIEVECTNW
jgi:hypothetical protein